MAITRQRSLLLDGSILREGRRLRVLNPGLFSFVFALAVANATVSLLTYSKTVLPFAVSIAHDFDALWDVIPVSSDHTELVEDMGRNVRELIPAAATYAVVAKVAASAFVGAIAALAQATVFLQEHLPVLVLVDMLFGFAVYAAHRCVDFVCAVGVVVTAEEPGRDGVSAALRHAWRLTALEPADAVLFMLVMPTVAGAASPFFVVAVASAPASVAWRALLGFVYVLCSGATQLVSVCAVTVFYYKCRQRCKEADSLQSDEPSV